VRHPQSLRYGPLVSQLTPFRQGMVAMKLKRCHVFAYNVDESLAASFKLPKARSNNEYFAVKYIEAGFDREAFSGEFFITFDEMVYDNKIKEAFEALGAGCVSVSSFAANDDNASASAALLRVWGIAARSGSKYTLGECDLALRQRTETRVAAQKREKELASEFDEKVVAALRSSMGEVGGKVDGVATAVVCIKVRVDEVKDIIAQKNVLELSADTEAKRLKTELARVNLLRDQEENIRRRITQEVHKRDRSIERFEDAVTCLEAKLRRSKSARLFDAEIIRAKDEKIADCMVLVAEKDARLAEKDELISLQRSLLALSGAAAGRE
jgi:hypothetical protein